LGGTEARVRKNSWELPGALVKIINNRIRLSASDVTNFLACQHLTRLDMLHGRGDLQPPHEFDIGFQTLIERGEAHEKAVLEQFHADGLQVIDITGGPRAAAAEAAATAEALASGADVIYQGVLTREQAGDEPALLGRPDFLIRADLLPAPDGEQRADQAHYEVVDAKLARTAKARAVAQTTFYSHLLADLQGIRPRWMHLALGNGELVSFKVGDYAAYERQTRRVLSAFIAADPGANPPSDTYPEPVEHCAICRWSEACAARRRSDDDLSLIAGITKGQRRALKAAGIATKHEFANAGDLPELSRVGRESLGRARSQARLQVTSEDTHRVQYELLQPERDAEGTLVANRGLLALPEPAVGDLFFDIEGARHYSEDNKEFGLQYLFGIVDTADTDENGRPRYTPIWSFDRSGEKRAFEELIDFITERRQRRPRLHVYHYNHYEPTSVDHLSELHETRQEALGRLMGRFATREDDVDDLFRLGVFVDLYRVVRQGLLAGVESYSIKRLEPLCGYARHVDLRQATLNLIGFEAALDDGTATGDHARQHVIAGYNEDDCRATLALRDWLEQRRPELADQLAEGLPRPVFEEPAHALENPEVTRIRTALLDGVPAQSSERTKDQQARALLADLIDWHRREAKPAWWRYFHVRTLSPSELIGEPDALGGLTGGEITGEVKRSVLRRFFFPPQEHRFSAGVTALDPVTGRGWEIWDVNEKLGLIELKIGKDYPGPLPTALVEGGPPDTRTLAASLQLLGDRVERDGFGGQDAAIALLLRLRPAGASGQALAMRGESETAAQAAVRLGRSLEGSYLPIQGPPGTGKTYTGAEQIIELIEQGRNVGITATSHAVIHNLIDAVLGHATGRGLRPRIGQRADKGNPFLHKDAECLSYDKLVDGLGSGDLDVAAGTVWMWARPEFQRSVDTLFVDEAGQMSLANVLAVAGAARNIVLLGDPQQLAQPSQAAHPPGAGVSGLEHVLAGRATMPVGAGLLIDRTWRMHPRLCRFTSEVFYDGKLGWVGGLERQEIFGDLPLSGSGLRIVEVPHEGNTNASPEEAGEVAELVRDLVGREWCNAHGERLPIGLDQMMVITPFNAQIRAIEEVAAAAGLVGLRVGTVDKFQGREAPVVVYSMATSSADEAPRGMEFLYDLHRLNVATSRARAIAIIVANPQLIRPSCQTVRQMVLASALCQAWEAGIEAVSGRDAVG